MSMDVYLAPEYRMKPIFKKMFYEDARAFRAQFTWENGFIVYRGDMLKPNMRIPRVSGALKAKDYCAAYYHTIVNEKERIRSGLAEPMETLAIYKIEDTKDHFRYLVRFVSVAGFREGFDYDIKVVNTPTLQHIDIAFAGLTKQIINMSLPAFEKAFCENIVRCTSRINHYAVTDKVKALVVNFRTKQGISLQPAEFDLDRLTGAIAPRFPSTAFSVRLDADRPDLLVDTIRLDAITPILIGKRTQIQVGDLGELIISTSPDSSNVYFGYDHGGEPQSLVQIKKEDLPHFIEWFCSHVLFYLDYVRAYTTEGREVTDRHFVPSLNTFLSFYQKQNVEKTLWPMGVGPIPQCDMIQEVIAFLGDMGGIDAMTLRSVYNNIYERKCEEFLAERRVMR